MIISATYSAFYNVNIDQLLVSCIDCLISTSFMIIFLVCEIQKPVDFFEEK